MTNARRTGVFVFAMLGGVLLEAVAGCFPTYVFVDPDGAAPESGGPSEPSKSYFCDGRDASFCADFDQGALDRGWTRAQTDAPGSLSLDPATFVSPPMALRAKLTASDGGSPAARLEVALATTRRPIRVELDLKVASVPWSEEGNASIAEVAFVGQKIVGHEVVLASTGLSVTTRRPQYDPRAAGALERDRWMHLRLETDPRTRGGTLRLWLGSDPQRMVLERDDLDFDEDEATSLVLRIGLRQLNAATPALDVLYDNVVLELL